MNGIDFEAIGWAIAGYLLLSVVASLVSCWWLFGRRARDPADDAEQVDYLNRRLARRANRYTNRYDREGM